jgi:hypothetical protein
VPELMGKIGNRMETTMQTKQETISYVVERVDGRCKGWAKKLNREQILALDLEKINGAIDIPGNYLKNGTDLELRPFEDFIFWGEANHHNKQRGWTYRIYYPGLSGIGFITPTIGIKAAIKKAGHTDLMGGSGDIAGIVRMAKFICQPCEIGERIVRRDFLFNVE